MNNMKKHDSFALRFGIVMLMIFVWAMPLLATSFPTPNGFRSTSPYKIENPGSDTKYQGNQNFGNKTYTSTIYDPFGNQTPSSGGGNPANGDGNGDGNSDGGGEDVGIPDWGGTMSEPLPIPDGTIFLLLIATIMITTIAIKQRKQKLQSITTNNNNTPAQHMTTRKQTYQSLFQKLFLLLAFVCIFADHASAQTKPIYFRPSTITIKSGNNYINWCNQDTAVVGFPLYRIQANGTSTQWHTLDTYNSKDIYNETQSRFLLYNVNADSKGFAIYRTKASGTNNRPTTPNNLNTSQTDVFNSMPGGLWWKNGGATWNDPLFTFGNIGATLERNLIGVIEGQWGNSKWNGYYLAYYVNEEAHLYFANIYDWTEPKFLRGVDVYTYKEDANLIPNTKLYYTHLAANTGIAYKYYAYIDNATGEWDDTEWKDLWKKYPDKEHSITLGELNANRIDNRINEYGMHTALVENKLAGTRRLFIPGLSNGATFADNTLSSYEALNGGITIHVQTYTRQSPKAGYDKAQVNDVWEEDNAKGGRVEYSSYILTGEGQAGYKMNGDTEIHNIPYDNSNGTHLTRRMKVAYTGEMHLKAIPAQGYQFIGWFDEKGDTISKNPDWRTYNSYTYDNETKAFVEREFYARFKTVEHNIRMQTPGYDANENWNPTAGEYNHGWLDQSNLGGTIVAKYTTNANESTQAIEEELTVDDNQYHLIRTHSGTYFHLEAKPKEGYTFIGWWNNHLGRVYDNPWYKNTEYADYSITARFAIIYKQTIEVNTYDANSQSFKNLDSNNGGTVNITYYDCRKAAKDATATITGSTTFDTIMHRSPVTLDAASKAGYSFIGWYDVATGEKLSSDSTYTHIPTTDQTIVARFSKMVTKRPRTQTYDETQKKWLDNTVGGSILFEYNHGESETISGAAKTLNLYNGSIFKATAIPNDGYTFIGWWNNRQNKNPEVLTASPWIAKTDTTDGSITARFAKCFIQTVHITTYNPETQTYEINNAGGAATIDYNNGAGDYKDISIATPGEYRTIINSPCTLNITTTNTGYVFEGWYDANGERLATTTQYSITAATANTIHARFVKKNTQTLQVIPSGGAGGTVNLTYDDGISHTVPNIATSQTFQTLVNTNIEVVANPMTGYDFIGWYYNGVLASISQTYSFVGKDDNATITAEFGVSNREHTVSIMTFDPTYNKYLPNNPGGRVAYSTNKSQGNAFVKVTGETSTAASFTVGRSQTVTLTATAESGYTFEGWYEDGIQITSPETKNNPCIYQYTAGHVSRHITARFKIGNGIKFTLQPNTAGTYSLRFSHQSGDGDGDKYIDSNVDYFYSKESSLTKPVISYAYSYDDAKKTVYYSVSNPKPILGYEFYCWHFNTNSVDMKENQQASTGTERKILADFRRTEDQVVYLNLNDQWKKNNHSDSYWVYAFNLANQPNVAGTYQWIKMEKYNNSDDYKDKLYTCTIPGGTYSHIVFIQFATSITSADQIKSGLGSYIDARNHSDTLTIPATRFNCYKLKSYYKNGAYHDAWDRCPTTNGDFRVLYIEQYLENNTIHTYYEHASDVIKQGTAGQIDTINLHIYNKVLDGEGFMNNPELLLQQWDATTQQWTTIERRMAFGPLKFKGESNIRMPKRKTTSEIAKYDDGFTALRQAVNDPEQDYGSGVWNFVIKQLANGKATILADATTPYTGNYYIRTANAEGMYQDFTHPDNIMTFSQYAKNNSYFSHYYCRYIDIPGAEETDPRYKDGKQVGSYTTVKFAVATDHAYWLSKELVVSNNRFANDPDAVDTNTEDIFIEHRAAGNAVEPRLRHDANVRFGWDSKTNVLTRAYIASSQDPNLDYLVLNNATGITASNTKFTEDADWLYYLDVTSQTPSTANVTAEVNGKTGSATQYFYGSEDQPKQLLGGDSQGNYPIRLLYDFKEDHLTTIYYPTTTITQNVSINTPVMILREHHDDPTQIQFNTNNQQIQLPNGEDALERPAYAVMTFLGDKLTNPTITHHEKMFYWVSFPYDVRIKDVFGLGKYGQYWIMQYYDGKQRATHGLKYSNWQYITNTGDTLKANVGYIICLNYSQLVSDGIVTKDNKVSLYFPSNNAISAKAIKGEQSKSVTLERYDNTNGYTTAWNHWNWHVIGVPSFADPTLRNVQTDVPFLYQYWHPGDAYAAVAVGDESQLEFHAMHSYMVQYAGGITWDHVVNTPVPLTLSAKTADEQADKKVMLRLELQQAGSTLDKTYVQLRNDKGTKGFDMSLDLTKIINAGANIYSVVSGDQMAGNAIPKDETVLPIGVVITAAGEYTFAMPKGTESMLVELIDYEQGTSTNLLISDYTIHLPKGTFDTRFALRLVPDKVATSVENIGEAGNGSDGETVRKLLIDGVLYLQKGNHLYDAQGHAL